MSNTHPHYFCSTVPPFPYVGVVSFEFWVGVGSETLKLLPSIMFSCILPPYSGLDSKTIGIPLA